MHGLEIIGSLLRYREQLRSAGWRANPLPPADPDASAWRDRLRRAARARRRARVAAGGAAASAGVAVLALPSVSPGLVASGALAAVLSGVAVRGAAAARRLRPDSPRPAPLPAPGWTGHSSVVRLNAAEAAVERLLGQAQAAEALGQGDAAQVRRATTDAARELRQVARRLAAAEAALRTVADARARAALDATVSSLAADLHEGVRHLEDLVAAAAEVVAALAPQAYQWQTAAQVSDALDGLRSRAAGLREIGRLDHRP